MTSLVVYQTVQREEHATCRPCIAATHSMFDGNACSQCHKVTYCNRQCHRKGVLATDLAEASVTVQLYLIPHDAQHFWGGVLAELCYTDDQQSDRRHCAAHQRSLHSTWHCQPTPAAPQSLHVHTLLAWHTHNAWHCCFYRCSLVYVET